jgi:hypothetical protein
VTPSSKNFEIRRESDRKTQKESKTEVRKEEMKTRKKGKIYK